MYSCAKLIEKIICVDDMKRFLEVEALHKYEGRIK